MKKIYLTLLLIVLQSAAYANGDLVNSWLERNLKYSNYSSVAESFGELFIKGTTTNGKDCSLHIEDFINQEFKTLRIRLQGTDSAISLTIRTPFMFKQGGSAFPSAREHNEYEFVDNELRFFDNSLRPLVRSIFLKLNPDGRIYEVQGSHEATGKVPVKISCKIK